MKTERRNEEQSTAQGNSNLTWRMEYERKRREERAYTGMNEERWLYW